MVTAKGEAIAEVLDVDFKKSQTALRSVIPNLSLEMHSLKVVSQQLL